MEGTIQKTKTGYVVYGLNRMNMRGYHGKGVAVAQPYKYIDGQSDKYMNEWCGIVACNGMNGAGYNNKMFVKAEFMPHKIEIIDIRVQRLQDISEDDCLAEGVIKYTNGVYTYIENGEKIFRPKLDTPRAAYADLIDKISGNGTWKSNPFVFCYTFNLVK